MILLGASAAALVGCVDTKEVKPAQPHCETVACVAVLSRLPTTEPVLLPSDVTADDFKRVKFSLASTDHRETDYIAYLSTGEVSGSGEDVSITARYATVVCEDVCVAYGPYDGAVRPEFSSAELARTSQLAIDGFEVLVAMPVGTIVRADLAADFFSPLSVRTD